MWKYDEKRYLTNTSQKYIMYDNLDFGHRTTPGRDRFSLITAMILGKILNRIVILPKFNCCGCACYGCANMQVCMRVDNDCAFNALFHVKSLDSHFSGQYREHTFLKHPKVPDTIKSSISPKIYMFTRGKKVYDGLALSDTIRIGTKDKNMISSEFIISKFGQGFFSEFAVLRFHSLDFNVHFGNLSWISTINDSLMPCNYRQDPRAM